MTDRECKIHPMSSRVCEKGTKSCTVYHQDRTQLCKEFTELTGGHWHELVQVHPAEYNVLTCVTCGENDVTNPTYENHADVLRVFEKLNNLSGFIIYLNNGFSYSYIDYGYIIEPDALLKAAVIFLKEHLTK